jgi:hypothetical protein
MLQITPQMKILVAVEPADFRKGIDGLVRLCKDALGQDPFAGTVFVARRSRFWCTTARVSGCVTNVFLKDDFAGGPPRRIRKTRRRLSPRINCRFCSQPAIRIAPQQHRTGVPSSRATDKGGTPLTWWRGERIDVARRAAETLTFFAV